MNRLAAKAVNKPAHGDQWLLLFISFFAHQPISM